MTNKNIELIRQALGAAESSIKLAKQLLSELESGSTISKPASSVPAKSQVGDLPGVVGIFDGENMIAESGETFPVPANYASKSMLVVGDTLKLVEEGKNKDKRFKQIEHVKRHKSVGILTKKDGKWKVVTAEGSYKVLGAAVEHFGADIGAEVTIHLPANNLTVAYGAIESVKGKEQKAEKSPSENVVAQPKEVKNEVPTASVAAEKVEKKVEVKKESQAPKPEPRPKPKKVEPKKEETKPEVKVAETKPEPVVAPTVPAQPPVAQATEPVVASPTIPMEVSPEEEELT